jgi:hypothetical protein
MVENSVADKEYLGDFLENIYSSITKGKLLKQARHGEWTVSLYYGPSLTCEDTNLYELEYTIVARTKNFHKDNMPDLSTGGQPTVVRMGSTTVISWTSKHRQDLLVSVERSFGIQGILR